MNWRCNHCGERFDEPRREREYQGSCFGFPAWERWSVCPCCGSEDIDEVYGYGYEDEDEGGAVLSA